MDLSRQFIMLNGQSKTLEIASIEKFGADRFRVRFKNNPRPYTYNADKVLWLSDPEPVDLKHSKVYLDGFLKKDICELWKFRYGRNVYWRIIHNNGYLEDDISGRVKVIDSCLGEKRSSDTFRYMKEVAAINPLHNDETGDSLLSGMFDKVDFVGDETAAACYLNPDKHKPGILTCPDLIYPFGCNASQKKAVEAAFGHQLSVIQGPPGTGKTQTILNIIANIVRQGKTVLVVSNNNSAISNVQEKLEKYGLSFFVAKLGSRENREKFVTEQVAVPAECKDWSIPATESRRMASELHSTLDKLDRVFVLQNSRAELRQERQAVELEWKHFRIDNGIGEDTCRSRFSQSGNFISVWLKCQLMSDTEQSSSNWFEKMLRKLKWLRLKLNCRYRLHMKTCFDKDNLTPLIRELQSGFYFNRLHELETALDKINGELAGLNAEALTESMISISTALFKSSLCARYSGHTRPVFTDINDLRHRSAEMLEQYPVILSTTFSARSCVFTDKPYDYIIMDEASQVSIETGTLALTCAYNAVIVGDTLQLPNVVTDEDRRKLDVIMKRYSIANSYDCAKNSFLQSVLEVVTGVPETLLREHYRCHPRIINFCNQKFYGGKLLIMTEDHNEKDVLYAEKTVIGNHCSDHYNQREIDVVKKSILPQLQGFDSIGIVTPYNNQVKAFLKELPEQETATIHKYQGREKDAIILSVVDNQISEFADDANMLNVAVSRAKKKFCLVVSGNEQEKSGNIMDLLAYMVYNNCTVTDSKITSCFDALYKPYTEKLTAFLTSHPKVSEYASENITFALISEILASDIRYSCLSVTREYALNQLFSDTSLMTPEEVEYASHDGTRLDFLISNLVSKKPVLAIETDGYSFHNDRTGQHRRDLMKDHILSSYGLPLLRLSTKGSGEREKISAMLDQLVG